MPNKKEKDRERVYPDFYVDEEDVIPTGTYKTFDKQYYWKVVNKKDSKGNHCYYCNVYKSSGKEVPINIKINHFPPEEGYPQATDEHVYPYGSFLSSVHLPSTHRLRWLTLYESSKETGKDPNKDKLENINLVTAHALDMQMYGDALIWGIFPSFYCKRNLPHGYPLFDHNGVTLIGFVGGRLSKNLYSALVAPIQQYIHVMEDIPRVHINYWKTMERTKVYGNSYKEWPTEKFFQDITVLRPKTDENENLSRIKRLNFIIFNTEMVLNGTDRTEDDENERTLLHMKVVFKPNRPIFAYKQHEEPIEFTTENPSGESGGDKKKKSGMFDWWPKKDKKKDIEKAQASTSDKTQQQ